MARCVVITGAAGGVGRATALHLDGAGWRCALVGRTRSTLEAVGGLLRQPHAVIVADLSVPGGAAAAAAAAREFGGGRVDALINAAGVAPRARIDATDEAFAREAFETNSLAPALLVAGLWNELSAARGRVVNASSMAAIDPFPGFLAYGASKAALESLTRSINVDGAAAGVVAHTLRLGAVETPMLRGLFSEADLPKADAADPADVAAEIAAILAGGRDGEDVVTLDAAPRDGRTFAAGLET